jgi:hypothetical protein
MLFLIRELKRKAAAVLNVPPHYVTKAADYVREWN